MSRGVQTRQQENSSAAVPWEPRVRAAHVAGPEHSWQSPHHETWWGQWAAARSRWAVKDLKNISWAAASTGSSVTEGRPFLNGAKTTHKVFQRFSNSWTPSFEWSSLLKPSLNPNVISGPTTTSQSTFLNTLNVFAGPETKMWVLLITPIKIRKGSCSLNHLSHSQRGKIQNWGCFTWSPIFFGFFLFQLHPR